MDPSRKPMWGIELPQFFVEGPVDIGLIRRFITKVEALGFDGIWVEDLPPRDFPWMEPISLLTYAAGLTSSITLGTNILITPLRDPVLLAKTLSTLDQLSNGRLILGIGMGGTGMQYEQYGVASDRLVGRFLESFRIINRLWSEPSVSYKGDVWHFENLCMEPKPIQDPRPPIWFGALHPDAIKRSVRYGDGWIGSASKPLDLFRKDVGRIMQFLEQMGRERSDFTIARQLRLAIDKNRGRAEARMQHYLTSVYDRWSTKPGISQEREQSIFGSPDECVHRLSEFVTAGVDVLIFQPVFDHLEHAELIATEVIPKMSSIRREDGSAG